jgi:hypothetical protein
MKRATFILLAGLAILFACPALAGPPFVTDDPEPAEYQHFEINTAMQGTYVRDGRSGAWPNLDINYGLVPDVQFTVNIFGAFAKTSGGRMTYGYGDTEVALKLRFIEEDEEGWRPMVAFYPNVTLPTGDAGKGLGLGHDRYFLPLWLQKSFGDWTTYGGGGYFLNKHGDTDKDYWFWGWTLLRKFGEEWTLGGEIYGQTADTVGGRSSSAFNFGGYYNIDDDNHVIFTFGRGLQNAAATNSFSYYVGYQVIF